MTRIAIIVGSTRPGRKADSIARWVLDVARKRGDAEYELVDIAEYDLPHLDEPMPPSLGQYTKPHTKAWAAKIDSFDGFVFVTPEYNHSTSGALKNAIDFLYKEWNNKAAGFVSYGSAGGGTRGGAPAPGDGRADGGRRPRPGDVLARHDFENYTVFKQPGPQHEKAANTMLAQVVSWSTALRSVRGKA